MIEGIKCVDVVLKVRNIGKWIDVSTKNLFEKKKNNNFFTSWSIYSSLF